MTIRPTCGHESCHTAATVVFRYRTPDPIARCWEHCPTMAQAIALGWMDPPTNPNHQLS